MKKRHKKGKNKIRGRRTKNGRRRAAANTGYCEGILCAGFGGQGIMFMGKLLAEAGRMAGKHVTWMPSYGAEVRGGTAYSMTKISDGEIANPIVTNPDILIVMNAPSFVKYEKRLKENSVLISNKSLVGSITRPKGKKAINIPMTAMAVELGDARCANMIALGVLIKKSKTLSLKNVLAALRDVFKNKEDLFLLNKKALETGYKIR